VTILSLPLAIAALVFSTGIAAASPALGILLMFVAPLLPIWASFCVTVQRYHDRGKSGFWFWIALIPIIGGIWQLIECGMCAGDDGSNAYGPPPGSYVDRGSSVAFGGPDSALSAKFDDAYFANVAKKLAQAEAPKPSFAKSNQQPSFGRRGVAT
jgi:hypothetical protein